MIRTDRLELSLTDFAAERKAILDRAEERLAEAVRGSLMRLGLPNWEDILVEAALDLFDETARSEVDEWNQVLDDMRDEFKRQLSETLLKTKPADDREAQHATITRWVSSMTINAATEAATTSDPDPTVGLEWGTMEDAKVRDIHKEAQGQTVPTGQPFDINGYELLYPGQPVGPPENWIQCRCIARPVKLTELAQKETHGRPRVSQEMAAGDTPRNESTIVVALPAESDPVSKISSEESGAHITLLFFGEMQDETAAELESHLEAYIEMASPDPFTDFVSGHAVLGADKANVVLLDGAGVHQVREQLLADESIKEMLEAAEAEQFPVWIPHVTLGYPETPALSDEIPEEITFDRIALWHGDEQKEYPLGRTKVVTESSDGSAITAAAEEEEVEEEEDDAPPIPEEVAYPEVKWHGVLAPEGVPSGDKRMFALGSLTNRDLPLPLKWMPADDEGHKGSVVAARIDRIFRDEEDNLIKAEGVFDYSEFGYEALRQVAEGMTRGVSVDVDSAEAALEDGDDDTMVFSSARIASATICAIPAFSEAYIAIGPWEDEGPNDPDDKASGITGEFAISEKEWDGSASRFDEAQWHKSCIVHTHEGGTPDTKSECKFPIKEPNGDLSRAGVHAAASRLSSGNVSGEQLSKAKASLRTAYKTLGEEPPENVTASDVSRETFENVPGVHKDGTPPKCEYCDNPSTKYVLHSEGMAYVPACDEHIDDAVTAAEQSVPGGESDPSNVDRIGEYSQDPEAVLANYPQVKFAPVPRKTKDGPGWITDPKPTRRITDYWVDGPGAAKISWGAPGDFNRCRTNLAKYVQKPDWLAGLCANLHYRALRAWPGQASERTEEMSDKANMTASVTAVPQERKVLSADWFKNPELTGPTPFTLTEDGHVFGHLATWDQCHIGFTDECKLAPRSEKNYAYYLTGSVLTDAGEVPVGQISLGGGHADLKLGLRAAMAHYDSTSTAVADITTGEDEFGVWFAGALRSDVDEEDKHALRAAALSGDWRGVRKSNGEMAQEMVAALAVNVPGFPIPRPAMAASGADVTAMVAAGIPVDKAMPEIDGALVDAALDRAIEAALARRERNVRLTEARAKVRGFKAEDARTKMALRGGE